MPKTALLTYAKIKNAPTTEKTYKLTKPFGTAELLVRIKVTLRRINRMTTNNDVVYEYKT